MTTHKDQALAQYIKESTKDGTIRWEPMATNAFTAALKGNHTVTIESDDNWETLTLRNVQGNVILTIEEREYNPLGGLFELARRNAYDVDKVIDEIMGGEQAEKPDAPIEDEDIPF
jgi:hypothetical protein